MTNYTQRNIIREIAKIFVVFIRPFYSPIFRSNTTSNTTFSSSFVIINPNMNSGIFSFISFPIKVIFTGYFFKGFFRMFLAIKSIKNTTFSTRFTTQRATPDKLIAIKTINRFSSYHYLHNIISSRLLKVIICGLFIFFFFSPNDAHALWYSSGYTNRFKITIDHNQVASASATFINFPVLITSSKSSTIFNELRTIANGGKASSGSGEFVFTQSDGVTTIPHEIERYTATTGDFLTWVNVPRLSSTADTILYMYYGGPSTGATNQNKTGTWDANFVGVWHLPDGTTLGALDSTSNVNNGTITGTVAGTGNIDGAGSFDGTNDVINVGSATSLDNISQGTITMWIKPTSVATFNKSLYLKRGGTNNFIFSIADTNAGDLALYYNQSTTNLVALTAGSYITTNEWQFVAGVWNSSGVNGDQHLYRGTTSAFAEASYNTQTVGSGTHDDSTVSGSIGARTNGTGPYAGIIDEVRISNSVRSADWIKTEYNNQNSPTTFASFSNDEDDLIEEE